ncbi:MAG: adenine deaminase [Planctomycetes bacterium]|nr:adenine deaminase [Planctomycetota bacterium]
MDAAKLISVAQGQAPADLLLKNARIVNVLSADVHPGDIAILGERIVGIGDYEARRVIDLQGAYVSPGFIDGHMHLESTMLTVAEFAKAVVPLGTTSVVIDPHEIANVMGMDGLRWVFDSCKYMPINLYLMLPSCVPCSDMETAGSRLESYHLEQYFGSKWVLGLAEMMNYPGVLAKDKGVLKKLELGAGKIIDGHAPGLSGKGLCAYVAAGIRSDHECTTLAEAREKLRLGVHIMIREGSTAKNLATLLPLVTPENARRFSLVTDDRHPLDLAEDGHINGVVRSAIRLGLPPVTAIQMVTLNTANYFHMKDLGAIAPGCYADLTIFDNFRNLRILKVLKRGEMVYADGKLARFKGLQVGVLRSSVNVRDLTRERFQVPAAGRRIKVIEVVPGQIVTRKRIEPAPIVDGHAVADPARDLLKIAGVERHQATGNVGLGFVRGFGLRAGAVASSVAHDSHNIIVVGAHDEDMYLAAQEIVRMQGGLVAVAGGRVLKTVPLPIAGLMSDRPIGEVVRDLKELHHHIRRLGCTLHDAFMTMSFLALPVIPELKLTDKGLVDVGEFRIVPLFS